MPSYINIQIYKKTGRVDTQMLRVIYLAILWDNQ